MAELALAIAVKGPGRPNRLIEALREARVFDDRIEVHLACDQTPPELPPGLVTVHIVENASLFRLWGVAIARSSAPYVAILHAQSPPAPGWAQAMLAALGEGNPLCGPVEPAYPPSDPRIIGYLVEYCQFHRPIAPDLTEVPGNNLIVPRAMLAMPDVLEKEGFSKTALLASGALQPRRVDNAVARHDRPFALLPFCARRFRHGRSYGALRQLASGTTPRILAVVKCFALPLVRVGRVVRHAWRHPTLRAAVLRRLPALLLAESCWSAGELVGTVNRAPGDPARLD